MLIGAHESVSGGYYKAFLRGVGDGCECLQVFTRNPRGWNVKPLSNEEIRKWEDESKEAKLGPNVSHAIYLINIGNEDKKKRDFSVKNLIIELERAEQLGLMGVVLHPGSNKDLKKGVELISDSINKVLRATKEFKVKLLLENVAGMGNAVGRTFEELRDMISGVSDKNRVGVCLDTCHLLAGGYDIVSKQKSVFKDFKSIVGLKYLSCFHLNDSRSGLNSKLDRHEHIGEGKIGLKAFCELVNNPSFKKIPGYMELPYEVKGVVTYAPGIKKLKGLRK